MGVRLKAGRRFEKEELVKGEERGQVGGSGLGWVGFSIENSENG